MEQKLIYNKVNSERMTELVKQLTCELKDNILKFWIDNTIDHVNGGFYSYIDIDMKTDKKANRSSVICARILWTFSKAYNMFKKKEYLKMAEHAYEYLHNSFYDKTNGGIFWSLDYKGNVWHSKKQVYAQAFAIYGLTEYYKATEDHQALMLANDLFEILENKCKDQQHGGYYEAFAQDWSPLEDSSLSDKDLNVPKSMNTNLHVMEAYTNLLQVESSDVIRQALTDLIKITIEKIIDSNTKQFLLYFDEKWNSIGHIVSFGHDIEGSWLLLEAAEAVGDKNLIDEVKNISLEMVCACYNLGFDKTTGRMYERVVDGQTVAGGTEWWTYAEAVVGFYNAYELTGDEKYFDAVEIIWKYISDFIVDKKHGEWFWSVSDDGKTILNREKVSEWKCPYHNSRMCFELISRIGR